jgi:hypothetical protein
MTSTSENDETLTPLTSEAVSGTRRSNESQPKVCVCLIVGATLRCSGCVNLFS